MADSTGTTPKTRPPIWKRLWIKTGLTAPMCKTVFKGAAPPIVALALYQWSAFAFFYTSIGYLVAIVTILSFPFMPRAKFMQTMLFNVIAICIGACINALTCYCAVKARQHTAPPSNIDEGQPAPGATTAPYNSSASAVAGIWLFFNVMFANAFRFKLPQFQSVIIIYSISANVCGIYAPQFPTMAAAEDFVKRLLLAFLGGFGIATVINFFVFPMTTRKVVEGQMKSYIGNLKQVLAAERDYLQSMETGDLHTQRATGEEEEPLVAAATKKLKSAISGVTALHGKLAQDLIFAKREIAWGKLEAKDFDNVFKLLRQILLPSLGIGSVADIFERVAKGHGWEDPEDPENGVDTHNKRWKECADKEKQEWNEIMTTLHEPFQDLVEAMTDALDHATIVLELGSNSETKRRLNAGGSATARDNSSSEDVEAKAGASAAPGDRDFQRELGRRIRQFSERNKTALVKWCERKGLTDADLHGGTVSSAKVPKDAKTSTERQRRHLYLILYLEFLLWNTAKAVLNLVAFADEKVACGQMKRSKLIVPGKRRIKKWILSSFVPEVSTNQHTPDSADSGFSNIGLPNGLRKRKDPEHSEPTNAWQRAGENLRKIGRAFASKEMAFGFRVAVATMSVAIMAFLESTQQFYVHERLFWSQIMVAISMNITSGSGIFAFGLRLLGTFCACIFSLILWYVAGGRGIPGALLPIAFLLYLVEVYFLVNKPRFTPVFMVMMITQVLILGYELEANKVGLVALTQSGQSYHPIYTFGWYRLATVAAGLAIAFFWTHIPYPLTAKNAMRKRLADSLFLLASYHSCVHATIGLRIDGVGGDPDQKGTPAHQLRKMRFKLVPKMLAILSEIRQHLQFTHFEIEIGGCFPKSIYSSLITEVNNIFNYISLIDYATATYSTVRKPDGQYRLGPESRHVGAATPSECNEGTDMSGVAWLRDLSRVRHTIDLTNENTTSILSQLSGALDNAHPLPPFLRSPRAYQLSRRIHEIDPEILSIKHVTEPGYAAFAVTQVAGRLISLDIAKILNHVRDLVGEVDFSIHPANEAALKLGEEGYKNKRS